MPETPPLTKIPRQKGESKNMPGGDEPLKNTNRAGDGFTPLLRLSFCFIVGACLGQVLARLYPDAAAPELRQSLTDYYRNRESVTFDASLTLVTLRTWFRVPLLAYLWGFTSLGVPLSLLTATAYGFLLSFSVGCFAAAFGWDGILLSAAAMGIRVLITLPCFFLLSLTSMERAAWLFRLTSARGPHREARPNRRVCVALCAAVLLAGAALDLTVTPRLLRLTLDWLTSPARTGFP